MSTVILRTTTRLLITILLLMGLFLLLRGHNAPGGGFIAGLTVTAAFVLYALAFDPGEARRMLTIQPRSLVAAGVLVALAAGLFGVVGGEPFLSGEWITLGVPGAGELKLGTPLLFDLGVAMVVVGTGVTILVSLLEVE